MKRRIATLIVAGVVLGGGAFAWAEAGPARPSVSSDGSGTEASLAVLTDASQSSPQNPDKNPAAFRQALQQCRQQAGIAQPHPGTQPTPPTAEQHQKVLACLKAAGFDLPHRGRGHGGGGPGAFLGRAIHGELIVPGGNGTFKSVVYDRGKQDGAVSKSDNKLTITRPDKVSVTVTLTDATKYRGVQNESQLQPGRPTVVVADKDGKALFVAQPNRTAPEGNRQQVSS